MNTKITLPRLASLLAQRSGNSKKLCEDFLKALFAEIADTIAAGESVKIKGLGIFKLTPVEERKSVNVSTGEEYIIPAHNKLSFLPSKELAAAVNAPFEMFETVELSDLVSEEELDEAGRIPSNLPEAEHVRSEVESDLKYEPTAPSDKDETAEEVQEIEEEAVAPPVSEEEEVPATAEETDAPVAPVAEEEEVPATAEEADAPIAPVAEEEEVPATAEEADAPVAPVAEEEETPDLVDEPIEPISVERRENRRGFGNGFFVGFLSSLLLICLIGGGYWLYLNWDKINGGKAKTVAEVASENEAKQSDTSLSDGISSTESKDTVAQTTVAQEVKKESVDEAPTEPSDTEKVYDTVTTTRYLTTIAKEHYGNYQFWPYIYEENKNILGHPNRIRPGTKVVVPSLKKYGVDPKSKADEKEARRKGVEIYARFSD